MHYHSLDEVFADYEILDRDDQYRLLLDLGRELEPMPDALKTDATLVRGCQAKVWAYPVPTSHSDKLHFLADSNSGFTKGMIALVLMPVQDKNAREILNVDLEEGLRRFDLDKHLSSGRASGLPNMIALIRATAARLAG
jgi:cysteine desulfuration protein SufE